MRARGGEGVRLLCVGLGFALRFGRPESKTPCGYLLPAAGFCNALLDDMGAVTGLTEAVTEKAEAVTVFSSWASVAHRR